LVYVTLLSMLKKVVLLNIFVETVMLFFSRLIDGKKVQKNRNTSFFKRILHPKMKILSSFTHPQVV